MKKLIFIIGLISTIVGGYSWASGNSNSNLDHIEVTLKDSYSLQNGAKLFVNYCLSCHSAKYMRYNRLAKDLNIPEELVLANMVPAGLKIGDRMTTTMTKNAGAAWFGVAPPDLSLIGKLRDADWLYSYLRGFYLDETTASGWNNVVFENVAMPHAMYELQGIQQAVFKETTDENGNTQQVIDHLELVSAGQMSTQEFDSAMYDLTNFLYYMGEPARMVRVKYGIWVLLFLGVLGCLAFMLKKEYWKDVH